MGSDFSLFFKIIPIRFKNLPVKYIKLRHNDKVPLESEWQSKNNYTVEDIASWIADGNNYGIFSVDGTVVFIDADTPEIQRDLDALAPTLHYTTGKAGHMHYIYRTDQPFKNIPLKDGSYVKAKNGMIVGIGSVHPNGTIYGSIELHDLPIATIRSSALMSVIEKYTAIVSSEPKNIHHKTQVNEKYGIDTLAPPANEVDSFVYDMIPVWKRANGMRHTLTLAIIGDLKRRKWDRQHIYSVIQSLIELTGEGKEHLAQVDYCLSHTGKEYGHTMLQKLKNEIFSQ
ncbi:MAG: bifunctional DNA primase/polymerase [Ignisphaera sp.]